MLLELGFIQFLGIEFGVDLDAHWQLIWVLFNDLNQDLESQPMEDNAYHVETALLIANKE